jgi:type II secretory pathway pseudopilin PulG
MKTRLSIQHSATCPPQPWRRRVRIPHSSAFTMVEIALSLAIIAFALVAIIGILPAGLSVQKDNREQTIINLDAAYLMDAIRRGPLGQDNLTNYIVSISQNCWRYNGNVINGPPATGGTLGTYTYTTNQTVINDPVNGTSTTGPMLTSGFNIIGFLSMPKYAYSVTFGSYSLYSNTVTAVFRAINAPAVDQGLSQASRDFAFQYQVTIELAPTAQSPFAAKDGDWLNVSAPNYINAINPFASDTTFQALQANLYEMRLTFRWPVLPNGQLGAGRQVFRSTEVGNYLTTVPPLPPLSPNNPQPFNRYPLPQGASYAYPNGALLFFMQPDTFTTTNIP